MRFYLLVLLVVIELLAICNYFVVDATDIFYDKIHHKIHAKQHFKRHLIRFIIHNRHYLKHKGVIAAGVAASQVGGKKKFLFPVPFPLPIPIPYVD